MEESLATCDWQVRAMIQLADTRITVLSSKKYLDWPWPQVLHSHASVPPPYN